MPDARIIAGAAAIAILAAVGWAFLLPHAPPPQASPPTAPGEPFAGAGRLIGAWGLDRTQSFSEAACRGQDTTQYDLRLDAPQTRVQDFLDGAMTIRIARQPVSGGCAALERSVAYHVRAMAGANRLVELTMTAQSCVENGKECPLVDRKLFFRPEADALVFGEDRLTKR